MKHATFLDKETGFKFNTKERTITEHDLRTFYSLWEEKEDLFHSDNFAESTELNFKGKIVAGYFLIAVMLGKMDVPSLGGGFAFNAALVGMDNIKFLSPAYEGDRLSMNGELLQKKTTSKGHVIVTWRWTLVNQSDTAIATGLNTELFSKSIDF